MREPLAVLRYTAEAMEEILNRILRLLALAVTLSLFATIAASADTLDNETFTISDIVGGGRCWQHVHRFLHMGYHHQYADSVLHQLPNPDGRNGH